MRHAGSLRVAYCSNNDKGLKLDRIERRSHKKTRSRLPSGEELVKSPFNKIARVELGKSKDIRNLGKSRRLGQRAITFLAGLCRETFELCANVARE